MSKLSTSKTTLLAPIILTLSAGLAAGLELPVKGKIDLSSNFCEYRPAHFHGGIDIRTGGKEGRKIYSPTDGYVWRLKYAYNGYGKALYLKDSKGFIYVFGHLSKLSDDLEKVVRDFQIRNRVYSFDNFYEIDSLPIKKGALIAFSGQSGIGAPHIHFEIRNQENMPLNPLTNGFDRPDRIPPHIESVGFLYQDDGSIFPDGNRRHYIRPHFDKSRRIFTLESAVPFKGGFGIMMKAYDRLREHGPRLNIYKARLFIDDYVYYETVYESYDYNETGMADLCIDYSLAEEENDSWHRLFIGEGKSFSGDKSLYRDGGIYRVDSDINYGLHSARAEIYDAAGNMTELAFKFVMLPEENMFNPVWIDDTTCFLEANPENRFIDLADISILGATGKARWKPLEPDRIENKVGGDIMFTVPSGKRKPEAIKILARGESGWELVDNYAVLKKRSDVNYDLEYKLIDGGILFDVSTRRKMTLPPEIGITFDDGYVKRIVTSPAGDGRFAAFYRDDRIKSTIIRFDLYESAGEFALQNHDVRIYYAGRNTDGEAVLELGNFAATYNDSTFYSSSRLELNRPTGRYPDDRSILGDVFSIGPKTTPLANNIRVVFDISGLNDDKIGIYRLNDKGKWRWLDCRRDGNMLRADSRFLGEFALLKDDMSPRVKNIYPPDGKTVFTSLPEIRCLISEDLSGIKNHENIEILLDGEWLIPEYDPEIERLITYPNQRLKDGRHNLKITVSDRVGNSRTVHTHFFVNTKEKN